MFIGCSDIGSIICIAMENIMNTYLDLLSRPLIEHWDIFNHASKVAFIRAALDEKLKVDPDYEVWVPFKYVKNDHYHTPKVSLHEYEELLLSNKARIYNKVSKRFTGGTIRKAGYRWFTYEANSMSFHRAMAYNFVPRPDRHRSVHYGALEVNHKDGVKDNNDIPNLEWVTAEENKLHAKETGLLNPLIGLEHSNVIPMRGTVVDIPGFKDYQFVVIGELHAASLGLSHKTFYRHRNETYGIKTHKGCEWDPITIEEVGEYDVQPPAELVEALKNYKFKREGIANSSKQKWVYIVTNIETGEVREMAGSMALVDAGFIYPNVLKCTTGERKTHKGHTFEKREAA